MERKIPRFRIAVLIFLVIVLAGICIATLYGIQVVHGESYYEESHSSIVTTSTVEAARGSILDRNGKVLVSSRAGYNIVLDMSRLSSADGAGSGHIIADLIRMALEHGAEFEDSLPITGYPFEYYEEIGTNTESNLRTFIQKSGLAREISAFDLVIYLREKYSLPPDLSDEELRICIGVLYEMELASLMGGDFVLIEDADIALITLIKSQGYSGVDVETVPVREYHTPYAAHILGHIGLQSDSELEYYAELGYDMNDYVGKEGVEAAFEEYLHGTDGESVTTTNDSGQITSVLFSEEPKAGSNVVLTLDIGLQEAAEKALEKLITQLRAEAEAKQEENEDGEDATNSTVGGGAAVVLDVNSAEVLAMASYPTFDLSTYSENFTELSAAEFQPLFNRATMGLYAPGSTFKMVTAAAGLDVGVISTGSTIHDSGKYTYYDDYQPACWIYNSLGYGHGSVNVTTAIEVSCNYFFYETGRLLGIDNISTFAQAFGLGLRTGLELPEEAGYVDSIEYRKSLGEGWNPGDTLQAAIGQGKHQFTPLQLANYTATLCNGGTRYRTTLLREIKSGDYSLVQHSNSPVAEEQLELNEEHLNAILQGMYRSARYGTPSAIFGDYDIDIGAKTGTAEISEKSVSNGVFVCFAPFDEPEVAIAVVVERGGSGSAVAAVARDILDYYFSSCVRDDSVSAENTLLK